MAKASGKVMATLDLDLFSEPPSEGAVFHTRDEIITPLITLPNANTSTPLEFKIPASLDCFTDLGCTMLACEFKLQFKNGKTEDEKKIPADADLAVANNFLMSAFGGAQLCLNDIPVAVNSGVLPWSAYMEVLTQFTDEARQSWLGAAGFKKDENPSDAITDVAKARSKVFLSNNGVGRFCGPILCAPFRTKKWIVPRVDMRLTLFRNSPEFLLTYKQPDADNPKSFSLSIEKAFLYVTRKKLYENAHQSIETALVRAPARYQFEDVIAKPIILAKDTFTLDATLIDGGALPKRLDVIHIGQQAAYGSLSHNPLFLHHYYMKSMILEKNSQLVGPPLQMDFSNQDYVTAYAQFFRQNGRILEEYGNSLITYDNYGDGFTMFRFNLGNFPSDPGIKVRPEFGTLRLKLIYDQTKLSQRNDSVVLMCLMTYDREFQIDHHRTVTRI